MVENQSRTTLILCGLAAMICFGFAIKLQPVVEEVQATGAKMAKVWMLNSVQRYREAWLLQGEPKQMEMDGFHLTMTESGLVSPLNKQGMLDCAYWLAVHFPQHKVMASYPVNIHGTIENNLYICNYAYNDKQGVVVTSNTHHLIIDVVILAE